MAAGWTGAPPVRITHRIRSRHPIPAAAAHPPPQGSYTSPPQSRSLLRPRPGTPGSNGLDQCAPMVARRLLGRPGTARHSPVRLESAEQRRHGTAGQNDSSWHVLPLFDSSSKRRIELSSGFLICAVHWAASPLLQLHSAAHSAAAPHSRLSQIPCHWGVRTARASGSVNRSFSPDSVRHMSVTTAAQRCLLANDDTR